MMFKNKKNQNLLLLFISIFFAISVSAQNKKVLKIVNLYQKQAYKKCVKAAEKYISKDSKVAVPYFYAGFSYFELSKKEVNNKEKQKLLKESIKYLGKASIKSKGDFPKGEISEKANEFRDSLTLLAKVTYKEEKKHSKKYFQALAKIYKDTTQEYREFYMPTEKKPDAEIVGLMKKGQLNVTDKNGLKQGRWKKVYSNGNTAYEVFFKNDKPIGKLKRYTETGELLVELDYGNGGNTASAKVYDKKGNVKADGFYSGKDKDKTWTYYYPDGKKLRTENYKKGKLNGKQIVYYQDGNIYEEKSFTNDIENGIWRQYYKNGKKITQCKVVLGKRQGMFLRYFKNGRIQVKGKYLNDLPEGTWEFYPTQTSKMETTTYINGVPENNKEIEDKETEEFLKGMKNGKNLPDPANFSNNPMEYIRQSKQ